MNSVNTEIYEGLIETVSNSDKCDERPQFGSR